MRFFSIILGVFILGPIALGAEVTAGLDRCAVLNSESDQTAESRIAVHFTLPEGVANKEIIYAELSIPVTTRNQGSDSLFEFVVFPSTADWTENDIDYDEAGNISDSLSAGSFTVNLAQADEFLIDITSFVGELNAEERTNYGLIVVGDLLGDSNLQIPENQDQTIRQNASLRIVYK